LSISSFIKPQGKKGLYTYRRRVPADLKAVWKDGKPQGEVKVGLKTANKALALKAGAEANIAFEQKAKNIRLGLQDEAEKTALEKLEERKWIIQTATQMLKQEGVLPEQQPRLSVGATLHDLKEWDDKVDLIKSAVIDALQEKYIDHDQRKKDYNEGRWGQKGYQAPYIPEDPNDADIVKLELLSGATPAHSIEPTWRDCVEIYISENAAEAQRTKYNQDKHERRVRKVADDLAIYLGNGHKNVGYETKLDNFSRQWALGFKAYCKRVYPNWSTATFNKGITFLAAAFNKGVSVFELSMNNPFEGLKIRNTPAHVSGVSIEENDRRSFTPEELLQYEDILKTKKSEIKTIGLLMIWTGCRTMEIGGLLNNELLLDLNVPYLLIRPNRIRRLKTLASERKVPLPTNALDILREYLQGQKTTKPDVPVFPTYGRDGGMDPLSQNLRNIIRKQMKVEDRRLVPYSTRHTLKDKMRTLRTPLMYQLDIMGQQKGNEIADGYGDGDPLVYLQQELQKASELSDWGLEGGAR
jgi:integrase